MRRIKQTIILSAIALLLASQITIAQKQWTSVGAAGFSTGTVEHPSLAIDNNGTPYVAYVDMAAGGIATVKKYNGTAWVPVGTTQVSAGYCEYTSITIDKNGIPFIVYKDWVNSKKATVKQFNGTNWVTVGIAGFSAGNADQTRIAVNNNGSIYVAYRDSVNGGYATVMGFNAATWVTMGNAGFSAGPINYLNLALDNTGTPCVAFIDSSLGYGVFLKFDGTSWTFPALSFGGNSQNLSMTIDKNGTPYVSYNYVDYNVAPPKPVAAYVKKFDGTNWLIADTLIITYHGVFSNTTSLAIDTSGKPFITVHDTAYGNKCTLWGYDRPYWGSTGNRGFSAGLVKYTSLVFDKNSTPYVAYQDLANSGKITVMKYGCANPTVGICAAITDTVTGSNRIVWNSGAVPHSYNVYRENGSSYVLTGTVAGNVYTFTDPSANPSAQSYKYKLTVLDSCGHETDINSVTEHKTMRLVFNSFIGNKASITWNKYEGKTGLIYTVKRSNNGGAFTTVESFGISGNDTTYLDNNPPAGSNKYRIDIALTNPCTAGTITYNKITSNIVSMSTGIEEIGSGRYITLAPNPADNQLRLSTTEAILKIEVYDMTGKKLLNKKGDGNNETVIDVRELPSGTYLLRVNDIHNTSFIKR